MFVKLWMKNEIISVAPDQTLAEAEALMQSKRIRRLLVTREDNLVGIITKEDIRRGIPASCDENTRMIAGQNKVEAYMAHNPITADPMDPLEDIALTMRRNKIGGVPVVEGSTLVGIITESDIFRAMTEILGAGCTGARVELKTGKNIKDLFSVIKLCKQFDVNVTAISLYQNFSEEHQLLTLRLVGDDLDGVLDALRESGCQVTRILRCHDGDDA